MEFKGNEGEILDFSVTTRTDVNNARGFKINLCRLDEVYYLLLSYVSYGWFLISISKEKKGQKSQEANNILVILAGRIATPMPVILYKRFGHILFLAPISCCKRYELKTLNEYATHLRSINLASNRQLPHPLYVNHWLP